MKWTEISVEVTKDTEEIVSDLFYEIGAKALSIEDPFFLEDLEQRAEDWDYIDESLVDTRGKVMKVKAYFSEEEDVKAIAAGLRELIDSHKDLKGPDHKMELSQVEEKDWAENWKQYYKPTRIGENIVIKPSWEDYEPGPKDLVIEIDPGMAFGTGTHETTSMCTAALEKHIRPEYRVYDIGTGSGILSMVAGSLGAEKVVAVDFDKTAVKVARENIEHLNLGSRVEVLHGNLLDLLKEPADLIVANIMADIIIGMTKDVKSLLKDGGIFISSGIILAKVDEVKEELLKEGFTILEVNRQREWAAIVAKK